jgi:WD40 repeat protein
MRRWTGNVLWLVICLIGGSACGPQPGPLPQEPSLAPTRPAQAAALSEPTPFPNLASPTRPPVLPTAAATSTLQPPLPPAGLVPAEARARLGKGGMRHLLPSPDGQAVAIASDGIVCLFALEPFKESWCGQANRSGSGILQALAFDRQGTTLATGLSNGAIVLWNPASGQPRGVIQTQVELVTSLAWSPDGTRLASSGNDGVVRIWDPRAGKELQTLNGGDLAVMVVAWSPDGSRIAAGDFLGTVTVFDARSGQRGFSWEGPRGYTISSLAWSPDSDRVLAGSGYVSCAENCIPSFDGLVTVWDARSGKKLAQMGAGSQVNTLAVSSDGTRVAAGLNSNEVRLYSLADGKPLQKLANMGQTGAFWVPGSQRLLSSDGSDRLISYDYSSGARSETPVDGFAQLISLAWSPDGTRLATGSERGAIFIWDGTSGRQMQVFSDPRSRERLYKVAWSPDGKQIGSIGSQTVWLWDAATGSPPRELKTSGGTLSDLAWSPDGSQLAALSFDGQLSLWNAHSLSRLRTFSVNPYSGDVAWSPDGKTLATAGNGIFLWDPATGKQVGTLGEETATDSIAWAVDGARFVANSGGRATIWEIASGAVLVQVSNGHSWGVESAALSPDGKLLASGAGEVILRNAEAGEILQILQGHAEGISRLAFSPDGRTLASGSEDGTIILWGVRQP